MNTANGVLTAADHGRFLHARNIVHTIIVSALHTRRRLLFSYSNNKNSTFLFKKQRMGANLRQVLRLPPLERISFFHIDDEGKQSLRDEI